MSKQKSKAPAVAVAPVVKAKKVPKVKGELKVKRGTARALRRANGNYTPVNKQASLDQAPTGRFARQVGAAQLEA